MLTLKTLRPGQKGTRQLLARYGTSLLCVRYRYDEIARQRIKTVELIVQRRPLEPATGRPPIPKLAVPPRSPGAATAGAGADLPGPSKEAPPAAPARPGRVALRIDLWEADLRRRVKSAGGWWNPQRRVWLLGRDQAARLDLLHRVVGGGGA